MPTIVQNFDREWTLVRYTPKHTERATVIVYDLCRLIFSPELVYPTPEETILPEQTPNGTFNDAMCSAIIRMPRIPRGTKTLLSLQPGVYFGGGMGLEPTLAKKIFDAGYYLGNRFHHFPTYRELVLTLAKDRESWEHERLEREHQTITGGLRDETTLENNHLFPQWIDIEHSLNEDITTILGEER